MRIPPAAHIDTMYKRECAKPSDINEHLPTLAHYARLCRTVTEFGVRGGVSTTALLYARPERLHLYDTDPACGKVVNALKEAKGHATAVTLFQMDTGDLGFIDPVDMLFIDTLHTFAHLTLELQMARYVTRFLALHDVEVFGEAGEDGTQPGLTAAVRQFMLNNPAWQVVRWDTNNNGLAVLERKP